MRIGNAPRFRPPLLVLSGFVLPWLPWLVYIASGWQDFVGQFRFVSERFEVLSPAFYIANAIHGRGPISVDWFLNVVADLPLARPGAWIVIAGVPVAAVVMASAASRHEDGNGPAKMLAICGLVQCVMFLALLRAKTVNYMIGLWPFAPLMVAWLGVWLWDGRKAIVRVGLLVLLALILAEGGSRIALSSAAARRAAPYDRYMSQIQRCIPVGSRVLGLQHYWLGLRQYDYRTWLVPANYTYPPYYHDPMPLDAALDKVNPDVILIDPIMRRYFEAASQPGHPSYDRQQAYEAFMVRRRARLVCTIQNSTYGTMNVYRVAPAR